MKVGGEISYGGAIYIGISPAKFIESILNNTINELGLLNQLVKVQISLKVEDIEGISPLEIGE